MNSVSFGGQAPPNSLADDIDLGENFEEQPLPSVDIIVETHSMPEQMPVEYLVLAPGFYASNFAKVYLLPDEPKPINIATLKLVRLSAEKAGPHQTNDVMQLFYSAQKKMVVGISSSRRDIHEELAHDAVELIFKLFKQFAAALRVYVLDFKSSVFFKFPARSDTPPSLSRDLNIFRRLTTSKEKREDPNAKTDPLAVRELEMPNYIGGSAAAVMTYCELNEIRATAYILYGSGSAEEIGGSIHAFRSELERIEPWKGTLMQKHAKAVAEQKIRTLSTQGSATTSMYG